MFNDPSDSRKSETSFDEDDPDLPGNARTGSVSDVGESVLLDELPL